MGGEADALGFTAGEVGDSASELEVAEADAVEESQALADFGEDVAGDGGGGSGEVESAQEVLGLGDRGMGETVDGGLERGGRWEADGAGDGIEAQAGALGAGLAVALLPAEPGLLDGVGAGAAFDIGEVEQFAEAAAARAPADGGVVAELFGVEGLEGTLAALAGALGGVEGGVVLRVECEEGALADLQAGIDEGRKGAIGPAGQAAEDDLHVVLPETVESQALAGGVEAPVGPHLFVTVSGGPFGDVGMKTLTVLDDRCEKQQIAAGPDFGLESAAELIAGLGFDGDLAFGAELDAGSGEEEAEEMLDFGDGGDGAFAAAAGVALFDADRGGDAGDAVDVGSGELVDELTRVGAHGVEEAALAFGEEEIERERAFARTADAGDDDDAAARDAEREVLEIMLAGALDDDVLAGIVGAGAAGREGR